MKNISDIIKTMTPEEKKLHKDLIDECLNRELEVMNHIKNINKNFDKLNKITHKLQGNFEHVINASNQINLALKKTDGGIH